MGLACLFFRFPATQYLVGEKTSLEITHQNMVCSNSDRTLLSFLVPIPRVGISSVNQFQVQARLRSHFLVCSAVGHSDLTGELSPISGFYSFTGSCPFTPVCTITRRFSGVSLFAG